VGVQPGAMDQHDGFGHGSLLSVMFSGRAASNA
jgi:hypothetical protein